MQDTFKFDNGTELKFEKFKIEDKYRLHVGQPAREPGQYVYNVIVYCTKQVFEFENKVRNGTFRGAGGHNLTRTAETIPFIDGMFPAITYQSLSIGVPIGVYVPIKWNMYNNRFEIFVTGLANDKLILSEALASPETKARVNKAEEEEPVGEIGGGTLAAVP